MNPLVSVILPVFNAELFLKEALLSIIGQRYDPLEILVVDDGSTDDSTVIARKFPRIKLFSQPNAGPGAARNRGVRESSGEYLAFLDADDLWLPEKLNTQVSYLKSHPKTSLVLGYVEQRRWLPGVERTQTPLISRLRGFVPGAMLIRRKAFEQVGFFPENRTIGEFIEWFVIATEKGIDYTMMEFTVLCRRIHGKNLVLREMGLRSDYVKILKAAMDRRRMDGAH